jgi:hypothetical protein
VQERAHLGGLHACDPNRQWSENATNLGRLANRLDHLLNVAYSLPPRALAVLTCCGQIQPLACPTSLTWPRRPPPEMPVIRSVPRTICHRENDTRTDRSSELDRLLDLLVSRSELLRTCEVRYRSRFAMQGEDKSEVHQLLGLGV